jgi:hypothetical protein
VHRRQDGFKAHLGIEPETGIVTGCELTKAAGSEAMDGATGMRLLAADDTLSADEPVQVLGDSAYGTGDSLAAITGAGHVPLVKPWALRAAVEGGFTLDDFTVDEAAATVICPAGNTRPISKARNVIFGALCRDCPLTARCTTSKTGRTINLHERDDLLRRARADWAAKPELREKYRTFRPNVERVVSQIASRGGRRLKLRYRGVEKNHAWLSRRTAGLNLRNLLGRGLTRTAGLWVLTPQTA